MDSHKTHKTFVQMDKWLKQTLGHKECCSAPSPCFESYVKDIPREAQKQIIEFVNKASPDSKS